MRKLIQIGTNTEHLLKILIFNLRETNLKNVIISRRKVICPLPDLLRKDIENKYKNK